MQKSKLTKSCISVSSLFLNLANRFKNTVTSEELSKDINHTGNAAQYTLMRQKLQGFHAHEASTPNNLLLTVHECLHKTKCGTIYYVNKLNVNKNFYTSFTITIHA